MPSDHRPDRDIPPPPSIPLQPVPKGPDPAPEQSLTARRNEQVDPVALDASDGLEFEPVASVSVDADPDWDPSNFAAEQTASGGSGVRVLAQVPVRRPGKDEWVRVHPGTNERGFTHSVTAGVYESSATRDIYLVRPHMQPYLGALMKRVNLHLTVSSTGAVFLWLDPVESGGAPGWANSRRKAIQLARGGWVRLEANMSASAYDVFQSPTTIVHPEWPAESMAEILKLAFGDFDIRGPDHPIVRNLTKGPGAT